MFVDGTGRFCFSLGYLEENIALIGSTIELKCIRVSFVS